MQGLSPNEFFFLRYLFHKAMAKPQAEARLIHITLESRHCDLPHHCSLSSDISPSTMSFGFGIGDFLGVGTLVWNVYSAYTGAPEQFRNFAKEILSLHLVYKKVENQLCNQGSGNETLSLSVKDTHDLKILHDGLQTIMEELDALLKKYQGLVENRSISFDRLRWGQEDLAGYRERVLMHIGLLTSFNTSLMWCVHLLFKFWASAIINILLPVLV